MKKFGFLIFIIAILVGVVFANLFSFGRVQGKLFSFSIGSSVKGSGVAASESRRETGFRGVDVGGIFQVEIVAGKDFSVAVEADDNLLPYIKTEVNGGVLQIGTTERISSDTPLKVRVSAPEIESVDVSGVATVSLSGVNNGALKVDTSGASKLKVEGESSDLTVQLSGASSVDAEDLKVKTASVDSSGASSASVFVTEKLVSDASGASKISYAGNPSAVEKNSSGASKIFQR